jgi:hypothetical protein
VVSTVDDVDDVVDQVELPPGTLVEVSPSRWRPQWLPGKVLAVSDLAALVRYQLPGRGTMVDTLLWERVRRRPACAQ